MITKYGPVWCDDCRGRHYVPGDFVEVLVRVRLGPPLSVGWDDIPETWRLATIQRVREHDLSVRPGHIAVMVHDARAYPEMLGARSPGYWVVQLSNVRIASEHVSLTEWQAGSIAQRACWLADGRRLRPEDGVALSETK